MIATYYADKRIWLHSCPKCNGSMCIDPVDSQVFGKTCTQCLSCGWQAEGIPSDYGWREKEIKRLYKRSLISESMMLRELENKNYKRRWYLNKQLLATEAS